MYKSHHIIQGTWIIMYMGCTIVYIDKSVVSIFEEDERESIALYHDLDYSI